MSKRRSNKNSDISLSSDQLSKKFAIIYGFNIDDIDDTGFLLVRHDKLGEFGNYDIVDDIDDATWFRYDQTSPEKWLEFFKDEPELKNWKFHIVKRVKS